jgi:hypothetical protein
MTPSQRIFFHMCCCSRQPMAALSSALLLAALLAVAAYSIPSSGSRTASSAASGGKASRARRRAYSLATPLTTMPCWPPLGPLPSPPSTIPSSPVPRCSTLSGQLVRPAIHVLVRAPPTGQDLRPKAREGHNDQLHGGL